MKLDPIPACDQGKPTVSSTNTLYKMCVPATAVLAYNRFVYMSNYPDNIQ